MNFINDACLNIKTILSIGHEEGLFTMYHKTLELPMKNSKKKAFSIGLTHGIFMASFFWLYAIIICFGTLLMVHDDLTL